MGITHFPHNILITNPKIGFNFISTWTNFIPPPFYSSEKNSTKYRTSNIITNTKIQGKEDLKSFQI